VVRRANDTSPNASQPAAPPLHTSPRALASYIAGWIATAGVAAALGLLVVRTISPDTRPLRRTDPIAAVRDRCVVRATTTPQRPPVAGRPSTPARTGVYNASPSVTQLVGALRQGVVVVQYRPGLSGTDVERLRRAFGSRAALRIVTPDATAMPYVVAGTAWGRLIGCRRLDSRVITALSRFATRYQGSGPDSRGQRPTG
jgi:hypothetical protein